MGAGREERPRVVKALVATLALHALLLWGRLPGWGEEPVRVDAPAELMKVQFLRPPPPPAPPKPPEPERKKVPRPDPRPDEPEPVTAPPAPPPAPEPDGPLRVSAAEGPGVIKRVEPIYPPLARTMRVEGVVVLDAVIFEDGTVGEVEVVKSAHPLLDRSAKDALKRWRFTPGSRDVIMTLTVRFVLE
jgi:protein TonB